MQINGTEEVLYYLLDREYDILANTYYDCLELDTQPWKVIKANTLVREWEYNARTGLVHEKVITKMQERIVENVLGIKVNTILAGHSPDDPVCYLRDRLDVDISDEWDEKFGDFIVDPVSGQWRISDYGIDAIFDLVIDLLQADMSDKLYWIDRILNVVHQRSDLAAWFVEGGRKTLQELAS